jgi:hypothetical protein
VGYEAICWCARRGTIETRVPCITKRSLTRLANHKILTSSNQPATTTVDRLGGLSCTPVPHALSVSPSTSSSVHPCAKNSWPIQFFVYSFPFSSAFCI